MVAIVYSVPLHKRPKYQGFFGAVLGIASTSGPLIGGAFTTGVTWRWCFYINLPLGCVVMVFTFFLLQVSNQPNSELAVKDKLRQLNAIGMLVLVPGVICLCLALQWRGTTYPVSRSDLLHRCLLRLTSSSGVRAVLSRCL